MPYARKTDPGTSHIAARSVQNISATQRAIINLLGDEGKNDEQLIQAYKFCVGYGTAPEASESGIRSRRAELVKIGLVVDTGERSKMSTGRLATVWKTTVDWHEEMSKLW